MEKFHDKRLEAELKALQKYVPSIVRTAIARDPLRPSLDRHTRDLSILFMDIAGCTRLCEILSPGRMQEVIEGYFSSFIDEVHELGGTINETTGDGLMILFLNEDPEDHALAAARAASLIHAHTREFAICWGGECEDLAVHIGINSGDASLGVLEFRGKREVRATYTASGPVINIAARLAALAPGEKTYVGEESWRRVKEHFNGLFVGKFELKNVGHPGSIRGTRANNRAFIRSLSGVTQGKYYSQRLVVVYSREISSGARGRGHQMASFYHGKNGWNVDVQCYQMRSCGNGHGRCIWLD